MKFKLIKEYPHSGKLGTIVELEIFKKQESIADAFRIDYRKFPEFWEEIKECVFTTEDGVELFSEDDRVFGVLPKANWQTNYYRGDGLRIGDIIKGYRFENTPWKYFSTKEKADEYIVFNKPIYSLNKIMETWVNCEYFSGFKRMDINDFLKRLQEDD